LENGGLSLVIGLLACENIAIARSFFLSSPLHPAVEKAKVRGEKKKLLATGTK